MSARIVLLGWDGRCAEIPSSVDAGALIASGMCRPSLTKWAGELADATVLTFRPEYLAAHGGDGEQAQVRALARALDLIAQRGREFRLSTPIPVSKS